MNNRTLIHQELQDIAPGLLLASVAMPYTFPPHYFLHLSSTMLDRVSEETTFLAGLPKEILYHIPAGYFDQFAQSVLQKLNIEHSIASDLPEGQFSFASISRQIPYTLPTDYFETLPEVVLEKAIAPKQQTVPAGYFENLPDRILATIRQIEGKNELDEIAPFLTTISKEPVQHVPQNYFENLEIDIPETKVEKPVVPVVSIKRRIGWFQYAAAASIAMLLLLGAYFLLNNNKTEVPSVVNQPTLTVINDELASLDTKTIENYLQISTTAVPAVVSIHELDEINNSDLDKLLQNFTDQQLKQHIEETPELPSVSTAKKL